MVETNSWYDWDAVSILSDDGVSVIAQTNQPTGRWLRIGAAGGGGGLPQVNADWNATSGVAQILNKPAVATWIIGEVKELQLAPDKAPSGFVLMDGRAKTTLTATQQAAFEYVYGTQATHLPNRNDAVATQTNGTIGVVSGSNTKSIARNQLPNIQLGGTANGASAGTPSGNVGIGNNGNHQHGTNFNGATGNNYGMGQSGGANNGGNYNINSTWAGDHSHSAWFAGNALPNHGHSITTDSLNGAVTQVAFDVRGRQIETRFYIYLGL